MEEYREVEIFGVIYRCEECNSGEMKYTGEMLMTNPPKFQHKCSASWCGATINLKEKYPTVKYEIK